MNKTLQNVLTLGASGRIENAQKKYEQHYNDYKKLAEEYESKRSNFAELAKDYLLLQIKAQKLAKKMGKFISTKDKNGRKNISSNIGIDTQDFNLVSSSISNGELTINAIKGAAGGVVTGVAVPSAMLSVATMVGTASTGTAISALSGAAQVNAATAWWAGGAVAAGGGGMAAGSTVIAAATFGVGAVIALGGMAVFSHLSANKKIKAIEEEELKLANEVEKIQAETLKVNYYATRILELTHSLKKAEKAFKHLYRKVYLSIFPFGFISVIYRKRKNIKYTDNDMQNINRLLGTARAMLQIRDTDIMKDFEVSK